MNDPIPNLTTFDEAALDQAFAAVEKLARDGQIVIAVGGGGIPAFYVEPNKLQGIDAVIDKDLASSSFNEVIA